MLVKTFGSALQGIDATTVTIEVNVSRGISFHLVGLPDSAVKESHQRIDSAIRTNGYEMPHRKTVINMAPADIRKEGAAYDLPLAVGIMAASGQLHSDRLKRYVMMGELSLDGGLQPIRGVLPIAVQARKEGFTGIIVPRKNAREAAVVNDLEVFGADGLKQVINFFNGKDCLEPTVVNTREEFFANLADHELDFSEVRGQQSVKRALEIAAAGMHNILMVGPPGAGKTMLARRLPTIMPPLSLHEALETTKIHSVAGKTQSSTSLMTQRPFRSPHHTSSDVALVGGGNYPQPGEISLAHNGVLFLDELPEFPRHVLEVLRQPLEDRVITISRSKSTVVYPSSFMLVAAMNPCPCGFYNHPEKECVCTPGHIQRYMNRISGPLLDRIDLQVEVVPVTYDELSVRSETEKSEEMRQRVLLSREKQSKRFEKHSRTYSNAQMQSKMIHEYCAINKAGKNLLKKAMESRGLSARAYDRILKVSRTIADLEGSEAIQAHHLAEAIQYRSLDRENWGY